MWHIITWSFLRHRIYHPMLVTALGGLLFGRRRRNESWAGRS
jgi:hypothetical protein